MPLKDLEARSAYLRAWRERNPEKIQTYRETGRSAGYPKPTREYHAKWRAKNPERVARYRLEHLAKMKSERPDEYRAQVKRHNDKSYLKRRIHRFGITPAEYFRLLDRQEMRCPICRNVLLIARRKRSTTRLSAHIDHDHETGRVRAILCGECNRGIGQLQDSARIMRRAAAYVEANSCQ